MNILSLEGRYFDAYLARLGHRLLSVGPAGRPGEFDLSYSGPTPLTKVFEAARGMGFEPDAILWCDVCRPPLVVGLDAAPVTTVGYSIDQYVNPWHQPFSATFDAFFVAQKDYLSLFVHRDLPRPLEWLPLFYDPDSTAPDPAAPRDIPVSFVGTVEGSINTSRKTFLEAFAQSCPLVVAQGDFRPVYNRSLIVLNQSCAGELPFRIFEAAALGAAVLTEDVGCGLRDLFIPGRDILPPYPRGNANAAAALARDWLARPDRLAQVAEAGHRLVASRHSASARARTLSRVLLDHAERQTWRDRLANRTAVRAELAKCYVSLATDTALALPLDHRQFYMNLAQAYLTG